ncbi:hypothetical protein LTR53_002410 [Teratosphaeriaceae sp. CCFEE 6253]|nr:hypothetical protein LTR53_002410 [Teratosphaeriaceae sp. CCFEE 6253]
MGNQNLVQGLRTSDNLFDGRYTTTSVTVTIASALALYNALEIILLILTTFRRFRGLYFYAVTIATVGLLMYTFGLMVLYFEFTNQLVGLTIRVCSWPAMVTGQSLVLYSRLGVVLGRGHDKLLRVMKWTIIIDAIVNHGGTIILTFGAYYASPSDEWVRAYNIQHKIQRTCFTVQECVLSALYIWKAVQIIHSSTLVRGRRQTLLLMWQLIAINVVIEALDVFVLAEEFAGLHAVKQSVKAMVYSIKLKLEFAVLGRLVESTSSGNLSVVPSIAGPVVDAPPAEHKDTPPEHRRSWSRHSLIAALHHKPSTDMEKGLPPADQPTLSISPCTVPQHPATAPQVLVAGRHLAVPVDEEHRRRSVQEDLYAGMCRDLAG